MNETRHFTVDVIYSWSEANQADLGEFMDRTVEYLHTLQAEDIAGWCDKDKCRFGLSVLVHAHRLETVETAVGKAMGLFRTAFVSADRGQPQSTGDLVELKVETVDIPVPTTSTRSSGTTLEWSIGFERA